MTTKKDIKLMVKLLKMNESKIGSYLIKEIGKEFINVKVCKSMYIFMDNCADVTLVAHLDTVLKKPLDKVVITDINNKIIISSGQDSPLGADDRAGVYTILKMVDRMKVDKKLRFNVLFTYGEEVGAIGASKFVEDIKLDSKLCIEFDKAGLHNVACVYDDGNDDFVDFLEGQGFEMVGGSFTDICKIQVANGISSVNLSANYYHQHTNKEYVVLTDIPATVEMAVSLTKTVDKTFPFKYKAFIYNYNYSYDYNYDSETLDYHLYVIRVINHSNGKMTSEEIFLTLDEALDYAEELKSSLLATEYISIGMTDAGYDIQHELVTEIMTF